ncbi:hsp90 co-chaperone Cdc37 [Rhizoclosmatium sp. JEL0117]|nr:hsp90 co-chaperone Cdc37 [Rhizoclosmatium sp. JEL0117]
MPLNYSKWDNLELSDDEDFECHPNVDKASMVRWKQAEVHRKRRERQDKIWALQKETDLNTAIVAQLNTLSVSNHLALCAQLDQWDKTIAHDVMVKAHTDRDPRWQPPTADPFFMKRVDIPALAEKIKDAAAKEDDAQEKLDALVKQYTKTFTDRNTAIVAEIKVEQAAIDSKISSETIKEGFSKSIVTKEAPAPAPPAPKKKTVKTKETEIVTLNDPTPSADADATKAATSAEPTPKPTNTTPTNPKEEDQDTSDLYITDPRVDLFSKLTSLETSYKYIQSNPWILSPTSNMAEKYSDQILAEAFNLAMSGDLKRTRECVHQSLLLQYCKLLGKDGVMLFFQRLIGGNVKAKEAFMKDVGETYERIVGRVKVLKEEERAEEERERREGEERVRAALQEDGTYKLPVSAESSEEEVKRAEVFGLLPTALQRALLSQDVDEINAFLSSSSKEDTEKYISLATSVGLISLSNEDDE